jgi:hypothetical protein
MDTTSHNTYPVPEGIDVVDIPDNMSFDKNHFLLPEADRVSSLKRTYL